MKQDSIMFTATVVASGLLGMMILIYLGYSIINDFLKSKIRLIPLRSEQTASLPIKLAEKTV